MQYEDGFEDVPQAEVDALTREELLAIATDYGQRRLVRLMQGPSPRPVQARDVDYLYPLEDDLSAETDQAQRAQARAQRAALDRRQADADRYIAELEQAVYGPPRPSR